MYINYAGYDAYVLRKKPGDARVRRTYVFSNRTIANMKYILGRGLLSSETEAIEQAISSFLAATGTDNEFPDKRVRKNYNFDPETIAAMDALINSKLVRNENEAIDLAMEWFATIYRMRESAAAIPIPVEKELITSETKVKKGKSALTV